VAVLLLIVASVSALLVFSLNLGRVERSAPERSETDCVPVEFGVDPELPGWTVMSWTLEGLGKTDLWLFPPNGQAKHQVTSDPRVADIHPAFSPDGGQIAFVRGVDLDQSNSVWICCSDGSGTRELVTPTSPTERFFAPVWFSPSRIGYTRDPQIGRRPDMEFWSIDVAGNDRELVFRYQDLPTRGNGLVSDVSPDGRQLVLVALDGLLWTSADVYVTGLPGRELTPVWEDDPDDCQDARAIWSPDGTSIAWHHNFTRGVLAQEYYYGVGIARLGTQGAWETQLQDRHDEFVTPLAWAPHGDQLLCARLDPETDRVTLLLVDEQLRAVRDLFELTVQGWQPGERHFARLADWAILPPELLQP
jgi:hypothetical protein